MKSIPIPSNRAVCVVGSLRGLDTATLSLFRETHLIDPNEPMDPPEEFTAEDILCFARSHIPLVTVGRFAAWMYQFGKVRLLTYHPITGAHYISTWVDSSFVDTVRLTVPTEPLDDDTI